MDCDELEWDGGPYRKDGSQWMTMIEWNGDPNRKCGSPGNAMNEMGNEKN